MTFSLAVLTPSEAVFEGEISSVVLPTTDGSIGFLPGRERTIVEVVPGDLTFRTERGDYTLETDGGVAEMNDEGLTVLCGTAYYKEEAETRRLERQSELSEERRRQEQSLADYRMSRVALIRAFDKIRRARIK